MEWNGDAREFLDLNLVDGGRSLQKSGRLTPAMKLHLSPIETRHEKMIRILVSHAAALTTRVTALERERTFTAHGEPHVLPGIGPYQTAADIRIQVDPGPQTPEQVVAHAYPGYRIAEQTWDGSSTAPHWNLRLVAETPPDGDTPTETLPEEVPAPIGPTGHVPTPQEDGFLAEFAEPHGSD